jgi:hypothetical protein
MRHRHTCQLVCGLLVVTGCGRSTETTTDRSVVDKQTVDALSNSVSPAPDTSEPTSPQQQFEATKLQIGMVAPEIEGADLDGVDFKLSDYRGKVVVLDFWGDW